MIKQLSHTFVSFLLVMTTSSFAALPASSQKGTTMTNPVTIEIQTSLGNMTLELDQEKAPKTVENFVNYVKEKFYDGLIFHRVIPSFMIQGGGFTPKMSQKEPSQPAIQNEAKNGLKNTLGTIAMARTADPHSATSQFFINSKDNAFLDYPGGDGWGYAVFGKVTKGLDVIEKISAVSTGNAGMHADVPKEPVIIESIRIIGE